ncbi:hypothetical protein GQ42DRAFT_152853 [Ramicandelaber brevisporus]|nr:hypothetical protein GQ42DRAFT_152853 [Ramicandelaber brevisporus]
MSLNLPAAVPSSLVDIRSSKLTSVSIDEIMLSYRLFEALLTLSNLHDVSLWSCVLAEPELVMNVFQKHRQTAKEDATVAIRRFAISTSMNNSNWSTELVLEMIASLPRLESYTVYGSNAFEDAIEEKYPKLL